MKKDRILSNHLPEENLWSSIRTKYLYLPRTKRRFLAHLIGEGKGKGHPRTGHEGPEKEQLYSSTLPSTSALDGGGQHHAPAALPPGKTRYPLYRRLGGPQGRSGRVRKNSPPTAIRSPDRPARSESLYRLSYPGRLHSVIPILILSSITYV